MDLLRALSRSALALTIAGTSASGCGYPTNVASGGACQRTLQCAPGLVCAPDMRVVPGGPAVAYHCTSDLANFGNGHSTVLDAGPNDANPIDASYVDAFADDANLPDTGVPNDAFVPPNDAFTPPNDAFVPPSDAFVPNDAFTPPDDAFVPPDDMGTDAG